MRLERNTSRNPNVSLVRRSAASAFMALLLLSACSGDDDPNAGISNAAEAAVDLDMLRTDLRRFASELSKEAIRLYNITPPEQNHVSESPDFPGYYKVSHFEISPDNTAYYLMTGIAMKNEKGEYTKGERIGFALEKYAHPADPTKESPPLALVAIDCAPGGEDCSITAMQGDELFVNVFEVTDKTSTDVLNGLALLDKMLAHIWGDIPQAEQTA